jgi:predicted dehydrogenase
MSVHVFYVEYAMSASSALRVGVVGLGKMGLLHAAICNSLPGSSVVAVADPAPLPRASLTEMNPAVHAYADAREMLDTLALDAVMITTPVAQHVPIALACVQRRVPFFVEKPLATSVAQALPLFTALQEQPLPHMIGYMTRYVDAFEKGQTLIASGCLGCLQRVTATIYVSQLFARGRGWRYERQTAGGGVLLSQGSHVLDLLTWYFGPVARVNADVQSVYSAEVEDIAHLMVTFESGLHGWVDCSWSVRFRRTVETTIDILGENGSLMLTDDTVRLFLDTAANEFPAGWTIWRAPDLYRGVTVDIAGPQYTREDQTFLEALRAARMPQPDIVQALHVQGIVDAAYASAARHGAPELLVQERTDARSDHSWTQSLFWRRSPLTRTRQ